nr:hypothetical protein GCM10017611_02740 [Rhodococcus wratislaviensis]
MPRCTTSPTASTRHANRTREHYVSPGTGSADLRAKDNGSEFINHHLLDWCERRPITFTRSRPGNSNDCAHAEQKNWAVVRTIVGYLRYETPAELVLLNMI